MIIGECPHCAEVVCNPMPARTPCVYRIDCEHCGKDMWIYATRVGGCEAHESKPDPLPWEVKK